MKAFLRRRLSDLKHTTALLTKAARTKAPRFAYVGGWLGHQNLGDEALFAAYKKLFPDYGLLTYGPATTQPALLISRWGRICAAGVLAGGTLIGRSDVNRVSPVLETFPISFVFGTGVANPVFWSSRDSSFGKRLDSWKPILERCCYIGVRGPMSAEVLADIGLDNVEVVGDPVLVFADRDYTANAGSSTASLGLNVGHSRGKVWGSEESMCEQFVRLERNIRFRSEV